MKYDKIEKHNLTIDESYVDTLINIIIRLDTGITKTLPEEIIDNCLAVYGGSITESLIDRIENLT